MRNAPYQNEYLNGLIALRADFLRKNANGLALR